MTMIDEPTRIRWDGKDILVRDGVDGRGYYIVYNDGPGENFVCFWPDEHKAFNHELSDVMAGPFWCKSDAERALEFAEGIATRFREYREKVQRSDTGRLGH